MSIPKVGKNSSTVKVKHIKDFEIIIVQKMKLFFLLFKI